MSAELRALAERATPGPWRWPYGGSLTNGTDAIVLDGPVAHTEDLAYIAAASPDVILALLDERDAAIRRASDLERGLTVALDALETVHDGLNVKDDSAIAITAQSILRHGAREARAALRSQESQKPPETADR